MPLPIISSTNGLGLPVRQSINGIPAEISLSGFGIPVIITDSLGLPMNISGETPARIMAPTGLAGQILAGDIQAPSNIQGEVI